MKIYKAHVMATMIPLLRTPSYWMPLIIFPTMLYSFFGIPNSQVDVKTANILLASWSAFAVIGIGFFQFGVSISQAREAKWENYARTLPVGGMPRFVAQIVTAGCFLTMALALLWTVAHFTTVVDLSAVQYGQLYGVLVVGVVPFVLMGAALGYSVPARGAVPIANLLYLPLSYFGGLWLPPQFLPGFVAEFSPYVPTRQLGELVWMVVLKTPLPLPSIFGLVVYSLVAVFVALIMWRRDDTLRNS